MTPLHHSLASAEILSDAHGHFWRMQPESDTGVVFIQGGKRHESRDDAVADAKEFGRVNGVTVTVLEERLDPRFYETMRICRDCKSILSVATGTSPDVVEVPCERGCE